MSEKSGPRPASVRVSESLQKLAESSSKLNAASGELAKEIAPLEAALKAMNLGVAWWHRYYTRSDQNDYQWNRYIGYAKVGGKWGLAVSQTEGPGFDDSWVRDEEWLFSDAPRWLRIEAFDHIPELLEGLVAKVDSTTEQIHSKLGEAKELAAVATDLVSALKKK